MGARDSATLDALRRYVEHGSDLSRPMTIDFFVAVPNEDAGEGVARQVRELGFITSVEKDAESGDWTCYCTTTVVPSFEKVRSIERRLDAIGRAHGGHADGFGSFDNAPTQ
jgi:hypothetical protein